MKKIFNSTIIAITTLVSSLLFFYNASANDYYWNPGSNNYYNTASNWKDGSYTGSSATALPTSTDNLFIGGADTLDYTINLNINSTINNLTIEGDGIVYLNTSTAKTLSVLGDVTNVNTNGVGGGTALIKFTGSSMQSLSGNTTATGTGKFCNIEVDNSAGVRLNDFITMGGSTDLHLTSGEINAGSATVCFSYNNTVSGNWTFNNIEFYGLAVPTVIKGDIEVDGNILLSGEKTFTTDGSVLLFGDISNEDVSTVTVMDSKLILAGENNQTFSGYDFKIKSLAVEKAVGTTLTLANNILIKDSLFLTSGNIVTQTAYLLTLKDSASVTGGGDTSYVDGPCAKIGNDSFVFPVGKAGIYNPISMSAPSSTSDVFVAEYFAEASSVTVFNSPITYIDPCERWNIDHPTGSSTVTVTLGWDTACFYIASLSYIDVARDSSSKWVKPLGTFTTTGNTTTGTITSNTARSSWGDVTLAKTNALVVAHAGRDTAVCYGQSVTLGGSPTGSGGTGTKTYSWSPSTGLSSSTITNPVATPTVTTTYILTVTDAISEFAVDTVTVTVNPQLIADAGNDASLCHGFSTPVGGGPTADGGTAPYDFIWTINSDTISTEPNPTIRPDTTASYQLLITDNAGCFKSDTTIITVHPQPLLHLGNDTTITIADSVILGNIPVATDGTTPYIYRWSPFNQLSVDSIANPEAKPVLSTVYTLLLIDSFGCNASAIIAVSVKFPEQGLSGAYAVLAADSAIIINDTANAVGKVGAGAEIRNISTTDSLLDYNKGTVASALNDLSEEIASLKTIPFTNLSSEQLYNSLPGGVYRYSNNATIEDTIKFSGDSSSYFLLIFDGNLTMQNLSCIEAEGVPIENLVILIDGNLQINNFATLNGEVLVTGQITADTLDGTLSLKTLRGWQIVSMVGHLSPAMHLGFMLDCSKATLSNITNNLAGKSDYFGYYIGNTAQKEDFGLGGFNNPNLIKNTPKLNSQLFLLLQSDPWDWDNAYFSYNDIIMYHDINNPPINEPYDYSLFKPFTSNQQGFAGSASNRLTDTKLAFDGQNAACMSVLQMNIGNLDYHKLEFDAANDLNAPVKYALLEDEPWADANYFNFPNAQEYAGKTGDIDHQKPV